MTDAYINDPLWDDAPEELPDGSFMLVREIKKAMNGEPFRYIPAGESKQSDEIPGTDMEAWFYFHSIHRYNQKFGLPNGKGWIDELPWVPEFLAYMDDLKTTIEGWRMKKNTPSGSGSPDMFMGG